MMLRLWRTALGSAHPRLVQVLEVSRTNPHRSAWSGRRVPIALQSAEAGPELLGMKVKGLEKGEAAKGDYLFATYAVTP
jgi:hypothetical protein